MLLNLLKIFIPTALAFFIGIIITPFATHFFYKHKMWKKYSRNEDISLKEFKKIHNEKEELKTPRVGGMIIWISVLITAFIIFLFSILFPSDITLKLNFLSRNQTLIPFFTLIIGSLVGLWDDLIQIYGKGKIAHDDISWRKWKVLMIFILSFFIGIWFYSKLDMTSLHIPFGGSLYIGALVVPLFIVVALATFSSGIIDGIDGLSGGVLSVIFASYAMIAYAGNQMNIAAFCGVVAGAILAFLWFNIPPARFYLGETGIMGLMLTLATIAFLTDSVFMLPVIAFPLLATTLSVILQMASKKLRHGKKLFKISPLHHHFEAIGWPSYKVTMRYWIISLIFAILGIILTIISR